MIRKIPYYKLLLIGLSFILLIVGCDSSSNGVITSEDDPMLSLAGIWENSFTYYTNTETGKIDTTVSDECKKVCHMKRVD